MERSNPKFIQHLVTLAAATILVSTQTSFADEQLFGYLKGAETLPKGAMELYQWVTVRGDKGTGSYTAIDWQTEFEYGASDRFSPSVAVKALSIDTSGLMIDGYLPGDRSFAFRFSGVEAAVKYNFLSPAKDPIGLAADFAVDFDLLDPHSGRDKTTISAEMNLLLQKYFLDGRLIWVGNAGYEATYAERAEIHGLPADFDWPTDPEMEIELRTGTGLSYRFIPNWYVGAEALYETEFETEVGQERWTWFAGPTLHYGGRRWWATLTCFRQLAGGGETYPGQPGHLHLIEKTEWELRLKIGLNF